MPRLLNKVLIVDDEPLVLSLLSIYLKAGGYEVCTASNGREALEIVEQQQPSYLVTDWEMPEIDGVELCRRVRKLELPGYLYIVVLTGRAGRDELMGAMAAGADDFLVKPLSQSELMARLGAGARVLQLESRLSQLADHDSLTELPTRRAFGQYLAKEWDRSRRYRLPLSVVMLDIDYFKEVNDTHGHPVGDEVIRRVANILMQQSRKSDVLCRYGGEEFCALLPETNEASALIWAERVRCRVAEASIAAGAKNVQVTISAGVAEDFGDLGEKEELLALADQCLLTAKERGRNRVVSNRAASDGGGPTIEGDFPDEFRLDDVLARDVMIPLFHTLKADWTIARAAAYFLRYRVSSVPVTDEQGCLLGIISEKDVLGIAGKSRTPQRRVAEIMRSNVIVYPDTAPLRQIVGFLTRASMRCVIITSQGKPCGMISRAALVRWFLENRWIVRLPSPCPDPQPVIGRAASGEDASLETLADHLVALAGQMRDHLQSAARDRDAAAIVGGASRMQQVIDDLLCGSPCGNPMGGGLPF